MPILLTYVIPGEWQAAGSPPAFPYQYLIYDRDRFTLTSRCFRFSCCQQLKYVKQSLRWSDFIDVLNNSKCSYPSTPDLPSDRILYSFPLAITLPEVVPVKYLRERHKSYLLDSNLRRASVGGSLHSGIKTIKDSGSKVSLNKLYNINTGVWKYYRPFLTKFQCTCTKLASLLTCQ